MKTPQAVPKHGLFFERKSVSLRTSHQETREGGSTILIRLLVALVVFLPEGIQKLAFADVLGAARFAKIGIPLPDVMGPFVGAVEIVCGALIILGLFTRLAAIPLIVIMVVAIVSTKIPILLGHDLWIFHLAAGMKRTGLWSMLHEARNDLTMLLGSVYLLMEGSGQWSLDAWFASKPLPSTTVLPATIVSMASPLDRTFQRTR